MSGTDEEPIDIIVPFGHSESQPERADNVRTVLAGMGGIDYPRYRVILAELGREPTQAETAAQLCDEYLFIESHEEFSPGVAQNAGFLRRKDPAPLVYFHQADFLVPTQILKVCVTAMHGLGCPFVYPYWGELHLSRPVTAAVHSGQIEAQRLYAVLCEMTGELRAGLDDPNATGEAKGHHELLPAKEHFDRLAEVIPGSVLDAIATAEEEALWGVDDRPYAPYKWVGSPGAAAGICRLSAGPRASAGYLCRDDAFREIGGVARMPGWGYEDLMTWLNVQAFFDYRADRSAVYFGDSILSRDLPLAHLWHSVSGRPAYYQNTQSNEATYFAHRKLSRSERRAAVRRLG